MQRHNYLLPARTPQSVLAIPEIRASLDPYLDYQARVDCSFVCRDWYLTFRERLWRELTLQRCSHYARPLQEQVRLHARRVKKLTLYTSCQGPLPKTLSGMRYVPCQGTRAVWDDTATPTARASGSGAFGSRVKDVEVDRADQSSFLRMVDEVREELIWLVKENRTTIESVQIKNPMWVQLGIWGILDDLVVLDRREESLLWSSKQTLRHLRVDQTLIRIEDWRTFWDVVMALESLELERVSFERSSESVVQGYYQEGALWELWCPRMKDLRLKHVVGFTMKMQKMVIKACPNLQLLEWASDSRRSQPYGGGLFPELKRPPPWLSPTRSMSLGWEMAKLKALEMEMSYQQGFKDTLLQVLLEGGDGANAKNKEVRPRSNVPASSSSLSSSSSLVSMPVNIWDSIVAIATTDYSELTTKTLASTTTTTMTTPTVMSLSRVVLSIPALGKLSFQALVRHFATLREIELRPRCPLESEWIHEILMSCPLLIQFTATSCELSVKHALQGLRGSRDEGGEGTGGPGSALGWACNDLKILKIEIEFDVAGSVWKDAQERNGEEDEQYGLILEEDESREGGLRRVDPQNRRKRWDECRLVFFRQLCRLKRLRVVSRTIFQLIEQMRRETGVADGCEHVVCA